MVQQYELKEAAEQRLLSALNDKEFELIDAGTSGIVWEEDGKEFYLHGQLYDVAKIKTTEGKTILYCINDKNEEQLMERLLKDMKSRSHDSGNKDGSHTIKFQLQDFTYTDENRFFPAVTAAVKMHYEHPEEPVSLTKKVNTPPPNKMHSLKI